MLHHPIATETIARQRMAERHAAADHHRAVRIARAASATRRQAGRAANVVSLWGRLRAHDGVQRAA